MWVSLALKASTSDLLQSGLTVPAFLQSHGLDSNFWDKLTISFQHFTVFNVLQIWHYLACYLKNQTVTWLTATHQLPLDSKIYRLTMSQGSNYERTPLTKLSVKHYIDLFIFVRPETNLV